MVYSMAYSIGVFWILYPTFLDTLSVFFGYCPIHFHFHLHLFTIHFHLIRNSYMYLRYSSKYVSLVDRAVSFA